MPITHHIDCSKRLVRFTAEGVLTDDQVLAEMRAAFDDPHFGEGVRVLVDTRGVTDLEVTTPAVWEMVGLTRARAPRCHRSAIVAGSPVVVGVANMYSLLQGEASEGIRVFGAMDEAVGWLELEEVAVTPDAGEPKEG